MEDPCILTRVEPDEAVSLIEFTKEEFRDIARNLRGQMFDEREFEQDWAEFVDLKRKKALN